MYLFTSVLACHQVALLVDVCAGNGGGQRGGQKKQKRCAPAKVSVVAPVEGDCAGDSEPLDMDLTITHGSLPGQSDCLFTIKCSKFFPLKPRLISYLKWPWCLSDCAGDTEATDSMDLTIAQGSRPGKTDLLCILECFIFTLQT
jgi:hypothetical protein